MLRLKYPRGIEWQVNGPETHKLYDASSHTIHLNLHDQNLRYISASGGKWGRDGTWASAVGVWRSGSAWAGGQMGAATTLLAPHLTVF